MLNHFKLATWFINFMALSRYLMMPMGRLGGALFPGSKSTDYRSEPSLRLKVHLCMFCPSISKGTVKNSYSLPLRALVV